MSEIEIEGVEEALEEELEAEDVVEEPAEESEEEMSVEDRAALVGWKPGGRKSAEEFLEVRDNHLGAARRDNAKLEKTVQELRSEQQIMRQMMSSQIERAKQQAREEAIKEFTNKKAQAIEQGDAEAFSAAEEEQRKFEQKEREEQTQAQNQFQRQQLEQKVNAHKEQYPEVFDSALKAEAWQKEVVYQVQNRKLSLDDAMKKATEEVANHFNVKRKVPGEEGGKRAASAGGKKNFASLPKEAKQAFENFKRDLPNLDPEQFASDYYEQV